MLDVTRSSKENIESVRLRVLWQINNEPDTGSNNQPDVVFASTFYDDFKHQALPYDHFSDSCSQEDLDLLSFSLDAVSLNARKQTLESLPLKAVYRDTVVGIRYLHPRDASGEVAVRSFLHLLSTLRLFRRARPIADSKFLSNRLSKLPNSSILSNRFVLAK